MGQFNGEHNATDQPVGAVDFPCSSGPSPTRLRVKVMPAPICDVWRKKFEEWISSPPFEKSVARNVDDPALSAWPGSYRWIEVELAWQAWLEAKQSEA